MKILSIEAELAFEYDAELGECPVWDDQKKLLCWVDILSGRLFRYDPVQKTNEIFEIGEHIGSFSLLEKGGTLVALQSGFAFYSFHTKQLEQIGNPESHLTNHRFNDGKCDAAGRFWSGTLSYDVMENAGSLYCMDSYLQVNKKLKNLTIPNGMAWNLNHQKFYFIDSPDRCIYVFDYDLGSGEIKNQTKLFEFSAGDFVPDGMTIDSEGFLWVALYNGYKVVRINPETKDIIFEVQLPVPQVTSCTFGGPDLNHLFITTAREHMTEQDIANHPLSGSLFKVNLPFKGLPAVRFKG